MKSQKLTHRNSGFVARLGNAGYLADERSKRNSDHSRARDHPSLPKGDRLYGIPKEQHFDIGRFSHGNKIGFLGNPECDCGTRRRFDKRNQLRQSDNKPGPADKGQD